jgi:hypothetical protein
MNFRILGPLEVTDGDLFLTKGDRPGAEQTRSMLKELEAAAATQASG